MSALDTDLADVAASITWFDALWFLAPMTLLVVFFAGVAWAELREGRRR
jgi:hypothetical protein